MGARELGAAAAAKAGAAESEGAATPKGEAAAGCRGWKIPALTFRPELGGEVTLTSWLLLLPGAKAGGGVLKPAEPGSKFGMSANDRERGKAREGEYPWVQG